MVVMRVRWYASWSPTTRRGRLYHDSWNNVRPQVEGKSALRYKGFDSEAAARRWLNEQKPTTVVRVEREEHLRFSDTRLSGEADGIRREEFEYPDVDLVIYTDGSYNRATKLAGWGYVATRFFEGHRQVVSKSWGTIEEAGTNNRGELMAIHRALDYARARQTSPDDTVSELSTSAQQPQISSRAFDPLALSSPIALSSPAPVSSSVAVSSPVIICSDSRYAISCLTEWHHRWLGNGWRTVNGEPVVNRDLIEQILTTIKLLSSVHFCHVRAHRGHLFNEQADYLARKAAGFDR